MEDSKAYGKVSIYALSDPTTKRVFYVGRSQRPESRFMEHLTEAERYRVATQDMLERLFGIEPKKRHSDGAGNAKKLKWIISILDRGLEVGFTILDEWIAPTMQDANRLEDAWIAEMRLRGHPICNVIYSRRMQPRWYGKSNPYFKPGWAETPHDYISMLKAGVVGSARQAKNIEDDTDDQQRAGKQYNMKQKRYFSKRSVTQANAAKKRVANSSRKASPKRRVTKKR